MSLLLQDATSTFTDGIAPLFWLHGEDFPTLSNELQQIYAAGMRECILEARPFPGWLEDPWWRTVEFLLHKASELQMRIWIFDDSQYPSGYVGGRIARQHPEWLKQHLRVVPLDIVGAKHDVSWLLSPWLNEADAEEFVAVGAARLTADGSCFDPENTIALDDKVSDGVLYWDRIPPGRWRIFLFIRTRGGGEEHTRDYLNMLDPEPAQFYLHEVYEAHYQHFQSFFGNTLAGFFSDESRFGNSGSYDATMGKVRMVLPYSHCFFAELKQTWDTSSWIAFLASLFMPSSISAQARTFYMNRITEARRRYYNEPIGKWCKAHHVEYIGHVVEDNGAHARLGYGLGHFFRAIQDQSYSGVDTVLMQNMPDFKSGLYPWFMSEWQCEFFHYGLAKLAASAGHLYPHMNGQTYCEIFGAYGWQLGLRQMKFLTDVFTVRGINRYIPHAFSPKKFPDSDCPPHFYAGGYNPLGRFFSLWSAYARHLSVLLRNGIHRANVAIVYHAEAEWSGGNFEPFESVAAPLARAQIDCDIIPYDLLADAAIEGGRLKLNQEFFDVLIVPYTQYLLPPYRMILQRLAHKGLPVIFQHELPDGFALETGFMVKKTHELVAYLRSRHWYDAEVLGEPAPDLQIYHYSAGDEERYFLVNENTFETLIRPIDFHPSPTHQAYCYDLWQDRIWRFDGTITLAPYESVMVIFSPRTLPVVLHLHKDSLLQCMADDFTISLSHSEEYPLAKIWNGSRRCGNLAKPGLLPRLSGTIRYEQKFTPNFSVEETAHYCLDCTEAGEILEGWLNGHKLGIATGFPYEFEFPGDWLNTGENHLVLEVTNTLDRVLGSKPGNCFDRNVPHFGCGLFFVPKLYLMR